MLVVGRVTRWWLVVKTVMMQMGLSPGDLEVCDGVDNDCNGRSMRDC